MIIKRVKEINPQFYSINNGFVRDVTREWIKSMAYGNGKRKRQETEWWNLLICSQYFETLQCNEVDSVFLIPEWQFTEKLNEKCQNLKSTDQISKLMLIRILFSTNSFLVESFFDLFIILSICRNGRIFEVVDDAGSFSFMLNVHPILSKSYSIRMDYKRIQNAATNIRLTIWKL